MMVGGLFLGPGSSGKPLLIRVFQEEIRGVLQM